MICKGNSQVGASAAVLTNEKWDQMIEDHRTFLGAGLHLLRAARIRAYLHSQYTWLPEAARRHQGTESQGVKCPNL